MKKFILVAPVLLISFILMAVMPSCKTTQVTSIPVKKADTIQGLTLLTVEKMNEYQLTVDDLKKITLLIGPYENTTILRRKEVRHIDSISNGIVQRMDSVKLDSIVIKPMTHGKVVQIRRTSDTLFLSVSFEAGKDSLFLTFKSLINSNTKEGFILCSFYNKKGELRTYYGKKSYRLTAKEPPKLYFILNTKTGRNPNIRVATGRTDQKQQQNPPVQKTPDQSNSNSNNINGDDDGD
jgi:hypothetical protein